MQPTPVFFRVSAGLETKKNTTRNSVLARRRAGRHACMSGFRAGSRPASQPGKADVRPAFQPDFDGKTLVGCLLCNLLRLHRHLLPKILNDLVSNSYVRDPKNLLSLTQVQLDTVNGYITPLCQAKFLQPSAFRRLVLTKSLNGKPQILIVKLVIDTSDNRLKQRLLRHCG